MHKWQTLTRITDRRKEQWNEASGEPMTGRHPTWQRKCRLSPFLGGHMGTSKKAPSQFRCVYRPNLELLYERVHNIFGLQRILLHPDVLKGTLVCCSRDF